LHSPAPLPLLPSFPTRRSSDLPSCLDPGFASARLTLRAMAIAATVIGDGGTMSAAGALIDMTAECRGAAARDGQQDLDMSPADPFAVALDESCSCAVDQVGHL